MTIDIKPVTQIIGEAAKQSKDRKPITKADVNNAIKALQRLGEENNSIIYRLNYLERAIKNISSITIEPSMPVFINSYELQGGNGLSLSIDTINKIININVGQGDGVIVSANSVEVDCTDLLGDGIDEDENNNFMVDCTDLLGWGIKEVNNNFTLDASINPTWTGNHIFEGTITLKTNIMPGSPDTYDIGSPTAIWRKAYISELEALIFAENTIFPIGGWFMITKDQGSLPTEMSDSQTTYDFGKTMTPNDFLVFRAAGVVEYIQIGSLVSGTTYNITRNLDGTGANTWAAGSTWACLGYNGNGRIELNAYDTPRINLITQGTTYNSQTELLRIGDLDGNWGYTSPTYGLAIGEYGSGKVNLTIDPTNGYRLRTYSTSQFQVTPNLLKFGADVSSASSTAITIFGADQTYNSESLGVGDLLIGDNTASKANVLWDKSAGTLLFRGGTTTGLTLDTTGTLSAGGGMVKLNSGGITITVPEDDDWYTTNSYSFTRSGTDISGFRSRYESVPNQYYSNLNVIAANAACTLLIDTHVTAGNYASQIDIRALNDTGSGSASISLYNSFSTIGYVRIYASTDISLFGPTKVDTSSTTALLVEQDGVKDNVLVVDTANGRVGINCIPGAYGFEIDSTVTRFNNINSNIYGKSDNTGLIAICGGGAWNKGGRITLTGESNTSVGNKLIVFTINGENAMIIGENKKVGIGNTNPSEYLDVSGNINCTGVIKIDGSQVLKERYIDSAINNSAADSYNNATKNLINCLKNMALHHQMVAAS